MIGVALFRKKYEPPLRIEPPPPRIIAYHKPTGEVVTHDDQDKSLARLRWKHYADRGYSITRHDLKLKETSA